MADQGFATGGLGAWLAVLLPPVAPIHAPPAARRPHSAPACPPGPRLQRWTLPGTLPALRRACPTAGGRWGPPASGLIARQQAACQSCAVPAGHALLLTRWLQPLIADPAAAGPGPGLQASPRAPASRSPAASGSAAGPPGARPTAPQQAGGVGGGPASLGRPLHRVDSASGGGGLQRGDSAASQGGGSMLRQAAALAPRQGRSRLAGASRSARGGQAGSQDMRELLGAASGLDSPSGPTSGSEEGSEDEGQRVAQRLRAARPTGGSPRRRQQQEEQAGPAAAAGGAGEPPHRRPRRNAVFGQLPGLGPGGAVAVQSAGAGSGGDATPSLASTEGSEASGGEGPSRRRRLRARLLQGGVQRPVSCTPPALATPPQLSAQGKALTGCLLSPGPARLPVPAGAGHSDGSPPLPEPYRCCPAACLAPGSRLCALCVSRLCLCLPSTCPTPHMPATCALQRRRQPRLARGRWCEARRPPSWPPPPT